MNLKYYWNTRTIFRKIVLIGLALHLLGCFLFPFAEMHSMTSSLSQLASAWGIADLPEKLTVFNLSRVMSDMGSEDGIFYMIIIVVDIVLLVIQLMGKKRASYVVTFIIWHVNLAFTGIAASAAQEVMGYVEKPFTTVLMVAILGGGIYVVSIAGMLFEYKAQSKLTAKINNGYDPSIGDGKIKIDQEKVDKLKAHAGNLADTGVAVAKKTAKAAVKGFQQASAAAKDFVESAKEENGAGTVSTPTPAPTPTARAQASSADDPDKTVMMAPKAIPQTGTVTGVRGMFAGAQIPVGHGESIIIGRAADSCHIILTGQAISRKHCVIQYNGTTGNYHVTDYSANGTFLGNGSKLPQQKSIALMPGSVIWIGNDENTFQLG